MHLTSDLLAVEQSRLGGLKHCERPAHVKCFPAGNATAAAYLFESLVRFSTPDTTVKLVIDGDDAGAKALALLLGRAKWDNISWKSNHDYFQLPLDVENLLSDRVKRALYSERPSQVQLVEDTQKKIKSFKVLDGHKKAVAERAIELSEEVDAVEFKHLFKLIHSATKTAP